MHTTYTLCAKSIERTIKKVGNHFSQSIYKSYKEGVEQKKKLKFVFFLVNLFSRYSFGNFIILCGLILGYKNYRIPEKPKVFLCFGLSKNNERIFQQLRNCLKGSFIIDSFSINRRRVHLTERIRLLREIKALRLCSISLTHSRNNNPFVQAQQIISCSSLLLFSKYLLQNTPVAVCIANDHSPVCIALIEIAKLLDVNTIYTQHAPVTSNFPPLDFDLSILFDKISKKIYTEINRKHNKKTNEIVLLSPFESDFKGISDIEYPIRIGICLSLIPKLKNVKKTIIELSSINHVKTILIRKHPRDTNDYSEIKNVHKVSIQNSEASQSNFFNEVDVVLVPNSGITIEALHSGKPCFYLPNHDPFKYDYYGFVSFGILPIYSFKSIFSTKKINHYFDHIWLKKYENLDATIQYSQSQMRHNVKTAIDKLISS